jgi:hypothetical protein
LADPHIEHLVPLPDEAVSGILNLQNSTETTMFAAAGSGMRNYLRFLHISTPDIANQVLIRDGAGGTILARLLATQNDNKDYEFWPALRGSENTVMTCQISGVVSTNYYVNGYGYKRAN